MSSVAPESRVGSSVGGRYKVLSVLGRGGMGVLYTAEHVLTRRRVALKLLLPDRDDLPELRARFLQEARSAAAVRHPNVVDVLDMGVDEDGSPFLAMELLEGSSLDQVLLVEQRLTPERALAVLLPILGALATLHAQGIVHRDVKPSNIFLSRSPRGIEVPKLLDFGLARTLSDMRLTRSGMVLGTPLYMAPEQAAGEAVNEQVDIWSMGVVLFECLSGELPFTSRESSAIAVQVLAGRVRALSSVSSALPVPLGHAVDRALRRDLNLRYGSARDFAAALVAAAQATNIPLPHDPDPIGLPEFRAWVEGAEVPSTLAVSKASGDATQSGASPRELPPQGASGQRTLRLLVLLGALVLALAGIWLWLSEQPATSGPRSADIHPSQRVPSASAPPAPPGAPALMGSEANSEGAAQPSSVETVVSTQATEAEVKGSEATPAEAQPATEPPAQTRNGTRPTSSETRRASRPRPVKKAESETPATPLPKDEKKAAERRGFDLESEWR